MTKFNINTKKLPLPMWRGGINSKNLKTKYTRILNQNIDLNKIKNLNLDSNTHKILKKSLKSRIAGLTKLNSNLNSLDLKNLINNKSTGPAGIALSNELSGEAKLSNNSTTASVPFHSGVSGAVVAKTPIIAPLSNKPKSKNMIADYVSYQKRQRLQASSSVQPLHHPFVSTPKGTNESFVGVQAKLRLKRFLQAIYGFNSSLVDLILSKDLVYNFLPAGSNNIKKFKLDSILDNSFYTKKSLTGTKVFEITHDNVTLQLFLYSKKVIRTNYLKYLCAYISKKIKKPFKLNLIRLRNLKSDSVISAKAIGIIANKIKNTVRPVAHRFLRNSRVIKPRMLRSAIWARYVMEGQKRGFLKLAYFTGAHIKLGGRLKRQRLTNRNTTMTFQKGSLNRVSGDLLTTARYTSKSVRGAFSITVTMGHKFF